MSIFAMQCIGYDEALQRKIAAEFPTWIPPPPKPKNAGQAGKANRSDVARGSRTRDVKPPTKKAITKVKQEHGGKVNDDPDYSPSPRKRRKQT